VLCDPLADRGSVWLLRWVTNLYGPVTRLAPWAWGAAYHACDSRWVMRLMGRTLLALADRPVADSVAAHEPAAIVSFQPLTGGAAARARRQDPLATPVRGRQEVRAGTLRSIQRDYVTACKFLDPRHGLTGAVGSHGPATRAYEHDPMIVVARRSWRAIALLREARYAVRQGGKGRGSWSNTPRSA
jgi:hypothetical protein